MTDKTALLRQALDGEDFYNVMQAYRHMPPGEPGLTAQAFEAVKRFVLSAAAPQAVHPLTTNSVVNQKVANVTDKPAVPAPLTDKQARIDLGRYAGTYGGYTPDPQKPRTLWQRFRCWLTYFTERAFS